MVGLEIWKYMTKVRDKEINKLEISKLFDRHLPSRHLNFGQYKTG